MSNAVDKSSTLPMSFAKRPPRLPLHTPTGIGSVPRERIKDARHRQSVAPHPLLPPTMRDFLDRLPKEDIDILLNPIRHGNIDLNTQLKLKRPGDRDTVNMTAGQLIAAVGTRQDLDVYYETVIAESPLYDDVVHHFPLPEVTTVQKPIDPIPSIATENKEKNENWIYAHRGLLSIAIIVILSLTIVVLAILLGTHSCSACQCATATTLASSLSTDSAHSSSF